MTNEKRPKSDDFGRFHIQIMYIFRKTLIIKVDCGERGINTFSKALRKLLIFKFCLFSSSLNI